MIDASAGDPRSAGLPSGTVSFLFTDIEGSTRLLQHLGEGYGDVLADHHRLLRAAFEQAGGQEMGTEGDAFFVAFRTARDVVTAAAAAQRALAGHAWPAGADVRVRMGIHTGEPAIDAEGYRGMALHRAARISAAGHGGQVLLSNATRELVEDDLPPGLGLRDLGEQRLKDIERPERIFQLTIDGLRNDFPPLRTAAPRRSVLRRKGVLAALLAAVVVAAIAVAVLRPGGEGSAVRVGPNSVAVIDPKTNRVTGGVAVGARPGPIAAGFGALWVANADDRSVSRVDPATETTENTIAMEEAVGGIAVGTRAVWAIGARPAQQFATLRRIDPDFNEVGGRVRVPGSAPGGASNGAVAVGGGSVWAVTGGLGRLSRVDERTGRLVATIEAGLVPAGVAVARGAVWVTDVYGDAVRRIDPETAIVEETIKVGRGPTAVAYGAGALWVASSLDDSVARIDPATNAPAARIPVGDLPAGVAVGEGAVWVANAGDGTVSRIDPDANRVVETIDTGGSPLGVAVADGRVWVTVGTREDRGLVPAPGTAYLEALSDAGTLDPALADGALSWQIEYATCAKLLNHPDEPAPAGARLRPEIARAQPSVSADGRTYTFTIRPGFRFSPPSREAVTARSFRDAIERSLSQAMHGPARGRLSELVGVAAFEHGAAAHIAGVEARGSTLTFRLTEPAPDFRERLALPYFCPVPSNTPLDPRGVRAVPSAGPYYAASYVPGQAIVLKRNPRYAGRRPHALKEIRVTLAVAPAQSLVDVEAGRVDYAVDGVPREAHARLDARYGPASARAKAGRQQHFVNPELDVDYLVLNARRPLFGDVRMRRAVNLAVDRRTLAPTDVFAPGQPTAHYLPPTMPGFDPARVYPLSPDTAAARRLAGGARTTAVMYTCDLLTCRELAQIVKRDLEPIGIDVEIEVLPIPTLLARLGRPGEPFDLAVFGHAAEVADPGAFLEQMLALPILEVGSFGARIAAADRLTGRGRQRALGRLANRLAREEAPLVAFANPVRQDLFSARIGCQVFNPLYGIDLAALCIRR